MSEDSFDKFYEKYRYNLISHALAKLKSYNLSGIYNPEDIINDIFLKFSEKHPEYLTNIHVWYRSIQNHITDLYRKERKLVFAGEKDPDSFKKEDTSEEMDFEELEEKKKRYEMMKRWIGHCTKNRGSTFNSIIKMYMEEKKPRQIAEKLGINIKVIYAEKDKFKKCLERCKASENL